MVSTNKIACLELISTEAAEVWIWTNDNCTSYWTTVTSQSHPLTQWVPLRPHTSTNSSILHGLVPRLAHAAPNGNHPFSVTVAVQFNGYVHLFCIRDTNATCSNKGGALCPGESFLKQCPVGDDAWTLPVEDADSYERHATTVVLKGQVESITGHRAKAPDLSVDLHHPSSQVHLGEALICCNSVYLDPGVFHPGRRSSGGSVRIRLIVKEIECLFAWAGYVRDATAIPDWELHLHVDPLCTTAPDVLGPHPVVLIVVKHIADLVRPDGVHVFIVTAHLLPLLENKKKGKDNECVSFTLLIWKQVLIKKGKGKVLTEAR